MTTAIIIGISIFTSDIATKPIVPPIPHKASNCKISSCIYIYIIIVYIKDIMYIYRYAYIIDYNRVNSRNKR